MKKENYLVIALTYIGTIIGAGFASGQEIKKFFVDYGTSGLIAFVFSAFLFFYFGKWFMEMGFDSRANSYDRILGYAFTCKAKIVFDYMIVFFLSATVTTMLSGTGAILNQNFGLPMFLGSFFMLVVSAFITIGGINKVIKLSIVAIPILIISTVLISINSFRFNSFTGLYIESNYIESFFSAFLYVIYNVMMAIAVLPVLGNSAKNKGEIKKASGVAGLVIGGVGIIICISLLVNYGTIKFVEVPLATLAKQSNSIYSCIYLVSFLIAVLTTAVSAMYGIFSRFNKNYKIFFGILGLSYIGSLIGFSALVKYLYTFMGYIGILVIFMLLRGFNKRKRIKKS